MFSTIFLPLDVIVFCFFLVYKKQILILKRERLS